MPPAPTPPSLREIHQQIADYLTTSKSTNPASNAEDLLKLLDPYINRPTLLSLPVEILKLVAYFCDLPSALALSSVSRQFNSITEARLWRDINLTPSRNSVKRLTKGCENGEWYEKGGKRVYPVRMRIKERLGMIRRRADGRRLGMVEEVTVGRYPGSYSQVVQLLEDVSPNLQSLVLAGLVFDKANPLNKADAVEPLVFRLLDHSLEAEKCGPGLHFPALTNVYIDAGTVDNMGFIALSCGWSPSLRSLHFNVYGTQSASRPSVDLPTSFNDTQIRDLSFGYITPTPNQPYERDVFDPVVDLLRHSPLLETLAVYYNRRDEAVLASLADELNGCENLRDLRWGGRCMGFAEPLEMDGSEDDDASWDGMSDGVASMAGYANGPAQVKGLEEAVEEDEEAEFSDEASDVDSLSADSLELEVGTERLPQLLSLQRLAIGYNGWATQTLFSSLLPFTPNLTSLCFIHNGPISISTSFPLPLDTNFAHWLRHTPLLTDIHFALFGPDPTPKAITGSTSQYLDKVETQGEELGKVWSLRHGDAELLHVSISVIDLDVKDDRFYGGDRTIRRRFICMDGFDAEAVRGMIQVHEPVWQEWLDYDGAVVPMEVMTRMREVEGVSEEDWQSRGVEVGAVAWRVLLDWREGLVM